VNAHVQSGRGSRDQFSPISSMSMELWCPRPIRGDAGYMMQVATLFLWDSLEENGTWLPSWLDAVIHVIQFATFSLWGSLITECARPPSLLLLSSVRPLLTRCAGRENKWGWAWQVLLDHPTIPTHCGPRAELVTSVHVILGRVHTLTKSGKAEVNRNSQ